VTRLPVRFRDCDPAGIAYFPALLALVDAAVEDWTPAAAGSSRAEMHGAPRRGLPTVDLRVTFTAPCRLGEVLDFDVRVLALGDSSVTLNVVVTCAGAQRFGATLVQVLIDLDTGRPVAWPADASARLRATIAREAA
jgi:4-hydroxybenzoyl-CoA thioesterase